jgi:hypothetical protein
MKVRRSNDLCSVLVNEGIVISKLKGTKQAENMMKQAGISNSIIERVLRSSVSRRASDWH